MDCRNAGFQIFNRGKRASSTLKDNFFGDFGAQAFDEAQAESQSQALSVFLLKLFERAKPVRASHVNGPDFQAVPLGIFDNCCGMIKTHRLIVQQGSSESAEVVAFQIGAGVGEKRETRGMRFRKSIERERSDGLDYFLLNFGSDSVFFHAAAKLYFDVFHARFGAFKTKGATQFLRFASREASGDHGHAQELFLKKRHAQRARENGFERWVKAFHRFASLAAFQIRMNHFANDRPGPNDRDLHHNVVKAFWSQTRQAGHLRAAFDLKHAHGVRFLQSIVNSRIIRRQTAEVNFPAIIFANDFQRIFQYSHHAQAEQIDFNNAHVGAIFFIPLHDDAAGHGRGFQRHNRIELALANDHSSGMLAQMTRQVLNGKAKFEKFANARMAWIKTRIAKLARECVVVVFIFPSADETRDTA